MVVRPGIVHDGGVITGSSRGFQSRLWKIQTSQFPSQANHHGAAIITHEPKRRPWGGGKSEPYRRDNAVYSTQRKFDNNKPTTRQRNPQISAATQSVHETAASGSRPVPY